MARRRRGVGQWRRLAWGRLQQALARGTERQRLTSHDARDGWPAWTPDGASLLFTMSEPDWFGVARLDLTSGETMKLTPAGAFYGRPNVSPDGNWIIVERR